MLCCNNIAPSFLFWTACCQAQSIEQAWTRAQNGGICTAREPNLCLTHAKDNSTLALSKNVSSAWYSTTDGKLALEGTPLCLHLSSNQALVLDDCQLSSDATFAFANRLTLAPLLPSISHSSTMFMSLFNHDTKLVHLFGDFLPSNEPLKTVIIAQDQTDLI